MTGLVNFLICWSGTVAVLAHEVDWLLTPELRVEASGPPAGWDALLQSVRRAHPDAKEIQLHAPLYPSFAAVAVISTPTQSYQRVFLDPYTAEVTGQASFLGVQRFFRSLHMSLFDPGGKMLGYWFVSLFGFLLLASAVTPLVFYRRWWRGFTLAPKLGRGKRPFWSSVHKIVGVWGLWFVILIALTGAWWTFEYAGVELGYPEQPETTAQGPVTTIALDALVRRAREQWPRFEPASIYVPDAGTSDVVQMTGRAEAWVVRDRANRVYADPTANDVIAIQRGTALPWPARWIDTVDPLHFGNFAGLVVKLVWFVFGLGLSVLCLSGAYLYCRRLDRGNEGHRGFPAAIATTAAVIAATGVGAWLEIRGYGPTQPVPSWPSISWPVAAFLMAWTGLTVAVLFYWTLMTARASRPLTHSDHTPS